MNPVPRFRQDSNALSLAPGDFLFREGESGEKMYVLLEGNAEIMVGDLVVETAGPGALLGEMALIDSGPRTATVVAKTRCRFAPIDQWRFQFLVQETGLLVYIDGEAIFRDASDEAAAVGPRHMNARAAAN